MVQLNPAEKPERGSQILFEIKLFPHMDLPMQNTEIHLK
jgi:hypothetical protein